MQSITERYAHGTYMRQIHHVFLPRASASITLRGYVGTLPNGYIKLVPLPRVDLRPRVNPRLKVFPKVPMDTNPTYRAQLVLQAVTSTQWQLVSRTKHLANRLAMVIPWPII